MATVHDDDFWMKKANGIFKDRIEDILLQAGKDASPKGLADEIFQGCALDWLDDRKEDNNMAQDEETQDKQLEIALWRIKEASWEVYRLAGHRPEVAALVRKIGREVNKTMRSLGFDPIVLVFSKFVKEG